MADLFYYRSIGVLAWPAAGGHWAAVSGPHGAGVLEAGLYSVGRREITEYTSSIDIAYKDRSGKGFFVPIYPQFTTHRGSDGRLGIHPDGNVPGTEGCIGITDFETKSFWEAMRSTPPGAKLILEVF